jgi:hypothetical protein
MELHAYLFFLSQESLRLYWPAFLFNIAIYFIYLWCNKLLIPLDANIYFFGRRALGDTRGVDGIMLSMIIGAGGIFITNSYLPFFSAVGANFGTVCESFLKRRLGFQYGQNVLFLDETDIILGATIFMLPVVNLRLDVFIFALFGTFMAKYIFNTRFR